MKESKVSPVAVAAVQCCVKVQRLHQAFINQKNKSGCIKISGSNYRLQQRNYIIQ